MGSSRKKQLEETQASNTKLQKRVAQLQNALVSVQEQANEASEGREDAIRQLAEITNERNAHSSKRRTRSERSDTSDGSDSENQPPAKRVETDVDRDTPSKAVVSRVRDAAVKFALVYGFWFADRDVLGTSDYPYRRDYDESKRFVELPDQDATTKRLAQGQAHELCQLLPMDLRHRRSELWFASEFHQAMRQQVSNGATRTRSHPNEILGPEIAALLGDVDDSGHHMKFKHFAVRIGYQPPTEKSPARYSALRCPILHRPETGTSPDTIFRSVEVKCTAVGMLRGVISAQVSRSSNFKKIHVPAQTHNQRTHKVVRAQPGLVAGASIYLRFGLSCDKQLTERGDTTFINYQKDYNTYLSLLYDGLRTRSKPIMDLFDEWDRDVFGRTDSRFATAAQATADDADHDELAEMRAEVLAQALPQTKSGQSETSADAPDMDLDNELDGGPDDLEAPGGSQSKAGHAGKRRSSRVVAGSSGESEAGDDD